MSAHPLDVVLQRLALIAPLRLAESWDNVGLLVGDRRRLVSRVMTCLTVTPEVVAEARDCGVNLLITHHPLPFKPLSKITSDTYSGKMLLDLIAGDIAVYSAHTAFDSAAEGINAMWADWLGLKNIQPLEPRTTETDLDLGSGRYGRLPAPISLERLAHEIAEYVGASHFRLVESSPDPSVLKVAIACGSGGSFVPLAKRAGCQALITGEATFHQCLEARASGVSLVLLGHYYSERFAMERLAERLASEMSDLSVFVSERDLDPLKHCQLKGGFN